MSNWPKFIRFSSFIHNEKKTIKKQTNLTQKKDFEDQHSSSFVKTAFYVQR